MKKGFVIIVLLFIGLTMCAEETEVGVDEKSQADVYEFISVDLLMTIMQEEGYSVNRENDQLISWKLHGMNSAMILDEDGGAAQFYLAVKHDVGVMVVNQWNKEKRYGRSYIDNDGDPCLESDLDLDGGVTKERIVDFLRTCMLLSMNWLSHINNG